MSNILIVDKDVMTANSIKTLIKGEFDNIYFEENVWKGLDIFNTQHISAIIVGSDLSIIPVNEFIQKVRQCPSGHFVPIIVLTSSEVSDAEVYESGADLILPKEGDACIRATLINLSRKYDKLVGYVQSLNKDKTTGLPNKETFYAMLNQQIASMERSQIKNVAVGVIDIDNFKEINDKHGHIFADEVLKQFTDLVNSNLRKTDALFRFGGDEFTVLMPSTQVDTIQNVLQRINFIISNTLFQGRVRLTTSMGYFSSSDSSILPITYVDRADKAMYTAKRSGKNQVIEYNENNVNLKSQNF